MARKNKHEQFVLDVLAETKDAIKQFRCDGAKEFHGRMMKRLSREFRFRLKKPARYIHEHAGKVERAHQTVDSMAKPMMSTASLPERLFWSLAGQAAVHVKNRSPTTANPDSKSPYEMRFGVQPDTSHFKVFGCAATSYKSKEAGRKKMEDSGRPGIFVGYNEEGTGYLIMNLETMAINVEGVVQFDEEKFPGEDIDWSEVTPEDSDDDYNDDEEEMSEDSEEEEQNYETESHDSS